MTLYLSGEEVRNTLKEIKQNTAAGSVIITDFYSNQFVSGDLVPGKKQLKITNEELGFGIAFEGNSSKELESLIESENMKLGQVCFMGNEKRHLDGGIRNNSMNQKDITINIIYCK